jgi:hypothetical protein
MDHLQGRDVVKEAVNGSQRTEIATEPSPADENHACDEQQSRQKMVAQHCGHPIALLQSLLEGGKARGKIVWHQTI